MRYLVRVVASTVALGFCVLFIGSCNEGSSDTSYEAFFYTRDIIWDYEAGRYKVQGEVVSDNRPFTVGYLQDDYLLPSAGMKEAIVPAYVFM